MGRRVIQPWFTRHVANWALHTKAPSVRRRKCASLQRQFRFPSLHASAERRGEHVGPVDDEERRKLMPVSRHGAGKGRTLRTLATVAVAVSLMASGSDASAQACVNGRMGRQMIEKRQIAPFPDAARRAGIQEPLAGVQLCPQGDGFVYRLRIPRRQGGERRMDIPAR